MQDPPGAGPHVPMSLVQRRRLVPLGPAAGKYVWQHRNRRTRATQSHRAKRELQNTSTRISSLLCVLLSGRLQNVPVFGRAADDGNGAKLVQALLMFRDR